MSYEGLGINPDGVKGSRWKDASEGRNDVYSWTIASTFGGAGQKKVTLILANGTENTFYHKHVLRRGENPEKVHAARNTRAALTEAMEAGDGRAIGRAGRRYAMAQNNFLLTNAGTSTFIKLDSIELKLMLYHMARKLAAVADRIPTGGGNRDVEIDFGKSCVIDHPGHRAPTSAIIVGVTKLADDGDRLTFDVNHCANNSDDYL